MSGSESSAPEPAPPWAARVLSCKGRLYDGSRLLGEASCLHLRGSSLYLAPLSPPDPLPEAVGTFQVTDTSGVLRLTGLFAGERDVVVNHVTHRTLELVVDPDGVRETNRRAHYRVTLSLKGELAVLPPEVAPEVTPRPERSALRSLPHLERIATELAAVERLPCVVRDLSPGGARLSLASPPPPRGRTALLDLALAPGERLADLYCRIVDAQASQAVPPFDAEARVCFFPMPAGTEARLARHLARVQRESLKKGIRG